MGFLGIVVGWLVLVDADADEEEGEEEGDE